MNQSDCYIPPKFLGAQKFCTRPSFLLTIGVFLGGLGMRLADSLLRGMHPCTGSLISPSPPAFQAEIWYMGDRTSSEILKVNCVLVTFISTILLPV